MTFFSKTIIATSLTFSLVSPVAVLAQSPSPTGTIRDAVKQKVNEELSQIKQAVAKKGFVGSITSKSEVAITVTTIQNQTRTANVTTDTTIKLQGSKDGTPADLKVGDFILVMGNVDSANVMTATRLLVIGKPAEDNREVGHGTVTKISTSAVSVQTKSDTLNLKITASTKMNDKYKKADIKEQSKVVVIYNSKTMEASRIHLIPASQ